MKFKTRARLKNLISDLFKPLFFLQLKEEFPFVVEILIFIVYFKSNCVNMSSQFPKIPNVVEKNYFCGEDFDVMKRNSMDNVFGVDKV